MTTYKKISELLTPQERKQVPGLMFLIFCCMLLETLSIGLIIPALALMTQSNLIEKYSALNPLHSFLGSPTQAQLVAGGMMTLLGLYVIKAFFMIFVLWRQNKFIFEIQACLSNRLFAGYLNQPWSFHLQRNSAQLIRNVTTEITMFGNMALLSGMCLLTEGSVLLGIVILLLVIKPLAAFFFLSTLGLAAWMLQRSIRNYVFHLGKARQHNEGMRIQHLQQGLGGAKDVKIMGRELDFLAQYNMHNQKSIAAARKQKTLADIPRLWIELLAVGGLVILVLVLLAQGTKPNELLPVLGLFAAASFRIAPSVNRILSALQSLRYSLPVINTLHEEMQLFEDTALPQRGAVTLFTQVLQLKNIVYHYKNAEHPALNGINLIIPRGASVGFVGASGSGKSTLVDVILGLLTPEQGHVRIDGVDIQNNLRGWQDQIGYVPQAIYLTDDTLRRNVAFGLSDELIDDEAVCRAIKLAQLEEFFGSLPHGMDTLVGERGVRLSGGQRQRIGIARALYHDPAVLVLDEATSALDMVTEKGVMEAINSLHGEKTLLIIAHRLSTVSNCDLVYKMEQGCITKDRGNYSPLLSASRLTGLNDSAHPSCNHT